MPRSLILTALLVGSAWLTTACSPLTPEQGQAPSLQAIDGHWTLIGLDGASLEGLEPAPTLEVDSARGQLSGFDGCNRYSGAFTFSAGRLQAPRTISTLMACTSDQAEQLSRQLYSLLGAGAQVLELDTPGARELQLKNAGAELRLREGAPLNSR